MKLFFTYLCLVIFVFSSCKKEPGPQDPNAVAYESPCTWDDQGRPTCLLKRDTITSDLLSFINTTLQEKKDLRTTHPELLSSNAKADIAITQPSDVYITFVFEGTGASNAFAFYTFPTNQPPQSVDDVKKITYVFPSVGYNTPLQAGDKVKIGRFEAGTSIGFVLLQGGWSETTKKPDPKAMHLFSNEVLNPETNPDLKKHAVLINYAPENKILIGYEDTNRSNPICDHDFNDVVLYATVKQ
jgi:hypothetical protein